MKKLLFVMVAFLFVLAACGGNEASDSEAQGAESSKQEEETTSDEGSPSSEETKADKEKEPSISVDKNLTNVEVTIPQAFFEMQNTDFEQIKAEAEAEGIKDVVNNGDGTITYKMSKSMHREMMLEMEKQMTSSIEEIKSSEDFPSIKDIKANKSFSKFTMKVDQEAYENSFDGFAAMGVGLTGLFYQLFDGANPDNYQVTIEVVNADTGKVFDTINYPEAFEQIQNLE
jgi:hypothetical protein